jgi:hypothetical protein
MPKPKTDLKPSKIFTKLKIPVKKDKYIFSWLFNQEVISKEIIIIFYDFRLKKIFHVKY